MLKIKDMLENKKPHWNNPPEVTSWDSLIDRIKFEKTVKDILEEKTSNPIFRDIIVQRSRSVGLGLRKAMMIAMNQNIIHTQTNKTQKYNGSDPGDLRSLFGYDPEYALRGLTPETFKAAMPKLPEKDFGKVMVFGTGGKVDKHWSKNIWNDIDKDYGIFKPTELIPKINEWGELGPFPILKNRRGGFINPETHKLLNSMQYFHNNYMKVIKNFQEPFTKLQRIEIYGYTI